VVMGTIGIVMLIACANVANLLLVRAEARQQELAIRAALGAGRGRIVRELLLESVLLGVIGGALGVGLAYEGLRFLVAIGPANLPRLNEISLDARALGFALILSLLSTLLFGLIPALKYAGPRISVALRGAGRTASVSRERHRSRNFLVVTQVAMALILLVGAGLMIRTFRALRTVEPGFTHAEHLQTMRVSIPTSLVAEPQRVTRIQNDIADRLAALPGVTSVGFARSMPMEGIEPGWNGIYAEGKTDSGEVPPLRLFNYVSPGFFHSAGTRMIAGRELAWSDVYNLRPVGMVSENLARELWGTPSAAIGKRFREYPSMPWHEVIGVVQNVYENGVQEEAPAMVYWPSMMDGLYGPHTFAQRDPASRLGSECESAGGVGTDDAGNLRSIAGANFLHIGDAGNRGCDGAGARGHRHLRCDLLRRIAAPARDRNSVGAWGTAKRAKADVRALGTGAGGNRRSHRDGGRGWADAADEIAAVRD
jgi:predicted permease